MLQHKPHKIWLVEWEPQSISVQTAVMNEKIIGLYPSDLKKKKGHVENILNKIVFPCHPEFLLHALFLGIELEV